MKYIKPNKIIFNPNVWTENEQKETPLYILLMPCLALLFSLFALLIQFLH